MALQLLQGLGAALGWSRLTQRLFHALNPWFQLCWSRTMPIQPCNLCSQLYPATLEGQHVEHSEGVHYSERCYPPAGAPCCCVRGNPRAVAALRLPRPLTNLKSDNYSLPAQGKHPRNLYYKNLCLFPDDSGTFFSFFFPLSK